MLVCAKMADVQALPACCEVDSGLLWSGMLCGVHLGVSHQAVLDRVCRQAGFSRMSLSCQASWANLGQKLGRGVGRYAWDNAAVCTSRSSVAMAGAGEGPDRSGRGVSSALWSVRHGMPSMTAI